MKPSTISTISTIKPVTINRYLLESIEHQSKLDIISAIYHQWNIAPLKQAGIVKAYLLNWTPSHFISQIANALDSKPPIIEREGISYQVIFQDSNNGLIDCYKARKIAVSFRHCQELELSVALIKLIY
jgi:hypothetical protein